MNEELMIQQIAPITDEAADQAVSQVAYQQLAWDIMRSDTAPSLQSRWRRRAAVGAVLTAAAVAAGMFAWPGGVGSRPAQALTFTRDGQYIEVTVRNPRADPARLRQEFAAHGMTVDLQVRPASPSLVGAMLSADDSDGAPYAEPLTRVTEIPGTDCGDLWCMKGVRIPVGLRTPVTVLFGRAPKPGEPIQLTGDATAHGEILHGVTVSGRTVAQILNILQQHHAGVGTYYLDPTDSYLQAHGITEWNQDEHALPASQVPGNWYVHQAWTGPTTHTVNLVVSPEPDQP